MATELSDTNRSVTNTTAQTNFSDEEDTDVEMDELVSLEEAIKVLASEIAKKKKKKKIDSSSSIDSGSINLRKSEKSNESGHENPVVIKGEGEAPLESSFEPSGKVQEEDKSLLKSPTDSPEQPSKLLEPEKKGSSRKSTASLPPVNENEVIADEENGVMMVPNRDDDFEPLNRRHRKSRQMSEITFGAMQDETYFATFDDSDEFTREITDRSEDIGVISWVNATSNNVRGSMVTHAPRQSGYRDESSTEKFDRLRGMKTSQQFEELAKMGEIETYPADCYSFIAIHSPFKKPQYFFFGVMVWVFQVLFLMYMILNKLHGEWGINGEVDNPSSLFFGSKIPANVAGLVRATQVTAILSYIVFADSSLRDCTTAIETFPRLDRAATDDRVWLASVSCFLRFTQGFLAIIATFLLIITSDDVIDIILNFAAVGFISNLDEVGFELAKWGKYGPALEREAKSIEERPIPFCIYRKHNHQRYLCTVVPIATLLMVAVISLVFWQESSTNWLTQTVRVQFHESTGLQPYSGCFDLDPKVKFNKRKNYNSHHENSKQAHIGYCKDDRQWILFKSEEDSYGDDEWSNDPCEVTRNNQLAHSTQTDYFDIYTSAEDIWFAADGTPLDLYFFETEDKGLDFDSNCGSFLNDGKCDLVFNTLGYQYDGGDCCAPTCNHANCGRGGTKDIFGSNGTQEGIGFHYCVDPSLVTMTIVLNKISSSRDPSFLEVRESQVDDYSTERGIDFWSETPVPVFFNIDCDHAHILSMYVDDSMESGVETILVKDGAHCEISVTNSTGIKKWDSTPIWWVNYTVYHGNGTMNEILSGFSHDNELLPFERIPDCYLGKLKEYVDVSTAYTANTDITNGLFWLVNDKTEYSDCDHPFLMERFAISSIYHAAPASPALEVSDYDREYAWITSEDHCRSKHMSCNNGSVQFMAVRKMDLEGTISTMIGLLTGLKRLEYDTNGLTGKIPHEIGRLANLTRLDIDDNDLTGTIPTEFGLLTDMIEFHLGNNTLSGTIPVEFGRMKKAVEFDVKHNRLTGTIPREIFKLTDMQNIKLHNNTLSGRIPSEIEVMKKLLLLQLGDNKMTGTIPAQIGQLKNLVKLDLKNNNFQRRIPTEIGLMTSLTSLDLRGNALTGPIPSELGLLTELQEIRLENNMLTGSIPFQITYIQRLVTLTIDNNLKGSIPKDIKTLDPCKLCNGLNYTLTDSQEKYYENSQFGIEEFDCPTLLKLKEDPDELLSRYACGFLGENCVACGLEPFQNMP